MDAVGLVEQLGHQTGSKSEFFLYYFKQIQRTSLIMNVLSKFKRLKKELVEL
jgi:hypothetical protein